MGITVTLEGRKPPVWEISGDTLEEFQNRLNEVDIHLDLLLAESETMQRFQGSNKNDEASSSKNTGGNSLRTAPTVAVGDGANDTPLPIPSADSETDDAKGKDSSGESGPRCSECGEVMDLSPKNAKRLYGRDDVCSDCGDALT